MGVTFTPDDPTLIKGSPFKKQYWNRLITNLQAVFLLSVPEADVSTSTAVNKIPKGDASGNTPGNAATATALTGATGGKWVEVVNSSVVLAASGTTNIALRAVSTDTFYLIKVRASINEVRPGYDLAGNNSYALVAAAPGGDDVLHLRNNTGNSQTFYYKVWAWE